MGKESRVVELVETTQPGTSLVEERRRPPLVNGVGVFWPECAALLHDVVAWFASLAGRAGEGEASRAR